MSKKQPSARKKQGRGKPKKSIRSIFAIATNRENSTKVRAEAISEVPLAICESDQNLQKALAVLQNPQEPIEVRLATLQALQAASFSTLLFEGYRRDYIAALRKVASDLNPELRQRALGMLAREKDGFAQQKLLEGLENPKKALVPPEKALQLLSYDPHVEAYAAAQAIVKDPPNAIARREALRLLSADADSASMFEKILRDKKEAVDVRQLSAAALHVMQPRRLQECAKKIVMDDDEDEELQATSLTALANFGDQEKMAGDKTLLDRVELIRSKAAKSMKQSARQFLDRYGK